MVQTWAVPSRVLRLSGLLASALLVTVVVGYVLGGIPAALAVGMGAMAASRPALLGQPGQAVLLTLPVAMAGAVAVSLRGDALAGALFVALCCLMTVPAGVISGGLLATLPTVASVLVAVPGAFEVGHTLLWMLVGSVVTIGLGLLIPVPEPMPPLPMHEAWPHAVAMAVAAGGVVFAVLALDLRHGYWVALTLTVLLRPVHSETWRAAGQRIAGTLGGTVLALVLASFVPLWGLAIALLVCAVLMLAYALIGDTTRQVLFMTPTVVLLGSAGQVGTAAAERVVATLLGCLLAGALALLLAGYEKRSSSGRNDDGQ